MGWQALLSAILTVSTSAAAEEAAARAQAQTAPRLLLLLTIDQARGDYLDRFRPALSGGLSWIHDSGTVFTEAHQRHAITVTAAGHASLSTGLYPSHSGVVGNNWYDRSEARGVYCVEDAESPILAPAGVRPGWRAGPGRSPQRLLASGLGDWVKADVPGAKVFSIGGKDRSAVLMGGKNPDGAFWYDTRSGQWISSRHYYDAYPDWVEDFQRTRAADAFLGTLWTPLELEVDVEQALSRMEISPATGFVKSLGRPSLSPDAGFYSGLYESPFVESLLIRFAERLVEEEALGTDDSMDVLALSFSSVDSVGHEYGPNSRELLDTIMRLDRELAGFFEFLDETVGLSRVAIALSADHGVAPLPDAEESRWEAERASCFQRAGRAFEARFGEDEWFVTALHFDYETLERRNLRREDVEQFLATELAACPSVAATWSRTEIERARWASGEIDPTLELYSHSFHPERSPDLYVQLDEFRVPRAAGTTHGSPYRYDTHVTAAILLPGTEAKRVDVPIATVDLPVTLAALIGIAAPDGLDGTDRSDLILGRTPLSQQ